MTSEPPVPFFRLELGEEAIEEVVDTLRSGWLTTGPKVRLFEERFATAVGGQHAVGLSSCTAALHLAVEALGLRRGQAVLVPTMTFAATAEVVRYQGALPVLVDCDPQSLNLDLNDARSKAQLLRQGRSSGVDAAAPELVGIIPVHVGGLMCDPRAVAELADDLRLWVVEDAAHAFPASWRDLESGEWRRCGEGTADVSCFSFYANKTLTTGEGGMAVTDREDLAQRMRLMSLHGLSLDAWKRYESGGQWDYRITAPGFKYNMTDIAGALGLHQLARAEALCAARRRVAETYSSAFADIEAVECPPCPEHVRHAWHIFPIHLVLERLTIDRDRFILELNARGIGTSVHWRPLHLHPYYQQELGARDADCPQATAVWSRIVTLPLFPAMTAVETSRVIDAVRDLCRRFES